MGQRNLVRFVKHILPGLIFEFRDVILHKQERRRLERTKVELKSSLRIDVGAVPSQPSPATLPLPETISEQVLIPPDTPFSDSPSFRNREVSPLPQNKPSTHSAISATPPSLMENDPQLESQKVLATSVISVGPRGHISACNDSELTSPTHYRTFSDTSQSFDARAHSPSLVNLGRRSVVRKRLVEMQNGSTSGGSTLRDPRLPPRNTVATLLARGRPVGMFPCLTLFHGESYQCIIPAPQINRQALSRLELLPL